MLSNNAVLKPPKINAMDSLLIWSFMKASSFSWIFSCQTLFVDKTML